MRTDQFKAIAAGFIASIIITCFLSVTNKLIVFESHNSNLLFSWINQTQKNPFGGFWISRIVFQVLSGTVLFSLIFTHGVHNRLFRIPWMKGIYWGLFLWFMMQIIIMPLCGVGLFSLQAAQPAMLVLGSFFVYFVYGVMLDYIFKY